MAPLLISHDHDRLLADRVGDLSGGIGAVLRGILLRGRTCYFTLDQAIYAIIKARRGDLVSGLFDKLKAAIKKKTSATAAELPVVETK